MLTRFLHYQSLQCYDAFPYSFCLLFSDFIQLQRLIWGLR
ncbi:hypothetical protein E2C01_010198 [Portunus trituberculatus]|uniref:Uncharacterized protein n=1 Tax=Portunus trituberculatus TaxID=210409 RepID=A0A5B7D818_PORTR|nr:hypothetical protein [Portunus trituberculatus]